MYQPMYYSNPQQIIQVNGENGARAYQMGPNCSTILLDETAPRIFLAKTDGAGYKTIIPYSIKPYEPEPNPEIKQLNDRISRLEEMVTNDKSNNTSTKRKQSEPAE